MMLLYMFMGKKKTMSINRAITFVWSAWRYRNGALTKDECDVLTPQKIMFYLKKFAGIDLYTNPIESVQFEIRRSLNLRQSTKANLFNLMTLGIAFENGFFIITNARYIDTSRTGERGEIVHLEAIQRDLKPGISRSLKSVLLTTIWDYTEKIKVLIEIARRYSIVK